MYIAMISEHASPLATLGGADGGGQNVYVAQLSRQLAALGHRVDVFTRREDAGVPQLTDFAPGVRVVQVVAGPARVIRKEKLLPLMDGFADEMRDFFAIHGAPDLIHAHFFMSGLVGIDLARAFEIPAVVTFHALGKVRRLHQQAADGFPDARFTIEERIVAEADRVIAECPEDERDLLALYGADPLRLRMVPCGFDPDEFVPLDKAEARVALGLPADAPIALQLGRMVPRKGVDTAIEALAFAQRDARLVVVGGASPEPDPARDPELARLIAVAERAGVRERVIFTGSRGRDVLKLYYGAADVFVTAPWYEPFGITPLEAMACARPVIASDVGGLRYTVAEGETGLRVPPRDPARLGAAMRALLGDPARAEGMGRAGLARVRERFTWRQVALQMEEVYRETLAKRAGAGIARLDPRSDSGVIDQAFALLSETLARSRYLLGEPIKAAAEIVAGALLNGQKVLVCGNGGSAADAQHFAAEFVGRFKSDSRRALPVIALGADTAFVTAWANDIGYHDVFARGVRAFGQPGDVLVAISTSGRSKNVVAAMREARERGLKTVALLGGALSPCVALADAAVRVPSTDTARIQEVQSLALHLICELVEARALAAPASTLEEVVS
ncbi:MAG: glycosyltransferase [Sphingomonas sp.]|uniref:glycosyltransferase n=1 Tax=Sphingomonas sp. TaxID=28214 RepID=UPI0025DDB7DE|nr:glycosyltransferase [Sphingomonas sp.]MBX9880439.1 glycosyltransferase [Sphingomonas sp.]